jgi:hypothetical protein
MANHILEHSTDPLNLSVDFYDTMHEHLSRAYALSYVALSDQFTCADNLIIQIYLGQLCELLESAKTLLDKSLKNTDNDMEE